MAELKPIISSRACPVCGEPVPWTRYWIKPWVWAKWPCSRCDSILTFDGSRRLWVGMIGGALGGSFFFVTKLYGWVAGFIVFIVGLLLFLFDRVRVAERRNPNFCRFCRYDISGTLAAGLNRCPECGQAIAATDSANTNDAFLPR